jgi:DNA-binding NarL/FixJ family response regulator
MPGIDGIEATERLVAAAPSAKVLVLSGSATPEDVDRAHRAGAVAVARKDRLAVELVETIVEAARG